MNERIIINNILDTKNIKYFCEKNTTHYLPSYKNIFHIVMDYSLQNEFDLDIVKITNTIYDIIFELHIECISKLFN